MDRKNILYKAVKCWKQAFMLQSINDSTQLDSLEHSLPLKKCEKNRISIFSNEKNLNKVDSSNYFTPIAMDLYKKRVYDGHKEATCLQDVLGLVGDPDAIRNEVYKSL